MIGIDALLEVGGKLIDKLIPDPQAKAKARTAGTALSTGKSGKSLPVTMAFTPGNFSAAEVSIDRMRACGCGLRRTLPWSIPGTRMSPT